MSVPLVEMLPYVPGTAHMPLAGGVHEALGTGLLAVAAGVRSGGVGNTKGPACVVREELDCQPCHGYFCEKFEQPECIRRIPVERVLVAIERVLQDSK